jgi:thiamine-phosphate pyrophosphorylase
LQLPRFYPILDSEWLERSGVSLIAAAEALLDAGARILQLRHKTHFSRHVFDQADQIARMCSAAGALFVINDRADMAMLLDAALHVGQDDLPPATARHLIGDGRVLGFSTHNETQLRAAAAEPVDYLAIGPIFGTVSKRNPDPAIGLDELRCLRSLTNKPLVAIGGITRATALDVMQTGADSIAVIGDLFPEPCAAYDLKSRAEEWLQLLNRPPRT